MARTLEISEAKLVSISYGVIGVFIASLVGFVLWLTAINSTALANSAAIMEMKQDDRAQLEILRNIDRRTAKIEGEIGLLINKNNH